MDDLTALRRYHVSKDPEAFTYLVTVYQRMVYAVCRRQSSNAADAEDATQETFLKLAKSAGAIRGNVAAWLHRCAAGTAKDLARKEATRRRHHQAASRQPDPRGTTESRELIATLDEALARLDAGDRELICGRFLAGRTQSELAEVYRVSQSMISRRVRRAVERLHQQMNRLGCGLALAALAPALETQAVGVTVPAPLSTTLVKIGLSGTGSSLTLNTGAVLMALTTKTKITAAVVSAAALIGGSVGVVKLWTPEDPLAHLSKQLVRQNYQLDESEDMRLLKPPYPAERDEKVMEFALPRDLDHWCAAFWWHGGGDKEALRMRASTLWISEAQYQHWVAESVLGLPWYGLGDHGSLSAPFGDWVVRADLTPEARLEGYAQVLTQESGKDITMQRSQARRECVVWRGAPVAPSPTGPDQMSIVVLSAATPSYNPDVPYIAGGHSSSLVSWFAQVGLPFLDETDGSVMQQIMVAIPSDVYDMKPNDPRLRTTVNRILSNLESQLEGGTFTLETRSLEVWTPVVR